MPPISCRGCGQIFMEENPSSRKEYHSDQCKRRHKRDRNNIMAIAWFNDSFPFPHSPGVNAAIPREVLEDVKRVCAPAFPAYYRLCLLDREHARWYPKPSPYGSGYAELEPLRVIDLPIAGSYLLALFSPTYELIGKPKYRIQLDTCTPRMRISDCTESWHCETKR